MKKMIFVVSALLLLAACQQIENDRPVTGEPIKIRICTEFPQEAADTRVALDESGTLKWEGGEKATLIFGKSGSDNSDNPTISSVAPGVFEGKITPPEGFGWDNLLGIVVPSENGANMRNHSSDGMRLRMQGYTNQSQSKNNEINAKYCPVFSKLSFDDLVKGDDGVYTMPSLSLLSAHDLIRFNVYGKHEASTADEVVKSVFIQSDDNDDSTNDRIAATFEYNLGKSGFGTNGSPYATVTLDEAVVLPADKENGVKLFMGVSLSGNRNICKVVVTTDRAEYTKEVSYKLLQKKDLTRLNVYQANLNLATFSRKDVERENYYKRKVLSIVKRAGLPSMQVTYTHGEDVISLVAVNEDFYAQPGIRQENGPLTTESVYQACSMSKVPLAYIAMKMVDEGRLDLMKPVYEYFGTYSDTDDITDEQEDAQNGMLALFADATAREKAKKITPKMILLHTTGLDNGTYSDIRSEDDGDSGTWEWKAEPGYTTYLYSGPAIHILDLLLGKILGDEFGAGYDDLAEYSLPYLFDKIGVVHANYFWKEEYKTLAAIGHYENGTWGNGSKWEAANAAFSLRISTDEYTRFLKFINKGADFNRGLESENYKAMFARYDVDNDTETSWQGYVWRLEDNADLGLMYHHRGNNGNYKGWMCTIPAEDKTLVFMTNGATSYNFYQAMAELFLGAKTYALASTGSALPPEESDTVGNAGQFDVESED